MTKIRVLSDLHMEGRAHQYKHYDEDVLVLAGDIHTQNRHHELISQIPEYVQILFVAGNHEYYGMEFNVVNQYFKDLEAKYKNFKWLNDESTEINDICFFGGTMFTDFNLDGCVIGDLAKTEAPNFIADFTRIQIGDDPHNIRTWNVQDHIKKHKRFCESLDGWLMTSEGKKRCVITHFSPTPKVTDQKYARNLLNGYFTANMEKYMGWDGVWLFGHTHSPIDTMLGDTRVVSNPKGYSKEHSILFQDNMMVEL